MREDLFEELVESVRQGGEILRGEREPSRIFEVEVPNVRTIRDHHGLSQAGFAAMLGIPVGTLRGWEQGRRKPEGAARVLLQLVARDPEVIKTISTFVPAASSRTGSRSSRTGRRSNRLEHHRNRL